MKFRMYKYLNHTFFQYFDDIQNDISPNISMYNTLFIVALDSYI